MRGYVGEYLADYFNRKIYQSHSEAVHDSESEID
jgi:hypothetical protein